MTLQQLFNETAIDSEKAWLEQKLAAPIPAKLAAFVAAPRFVSRRPVPNNPDATRDRLARGPLLPSLPFAAYSALAIALCVLAALPIFLGMLVVVPMLVCGSYAAYKDIFTA